MLKGISPLFSPELLATIYRMGHGDEIVFADAHFPGHSTNRQVIRADGLLIEDLLDAVLPLFALDSYVDDPVVMMECVPGDTPDLSVEAGFAPLSTNTRQAHPLSTLWNALLSTTGPGPHSRSE